MRWHKNDKRYRPEEMIHPSDGEAWKHFDRCNTMEAGEARNVRVVLATDGFNPYGMTAARTVVGPCLLSPSTSPLELSFNGRTYSCR